MRLILFDVDGTLLDSQNLIVAAMSCAFAEAELDAPSREAILSIVGLSLPEAVAALLAGSPLAPAARIVSAYRDAHRRLKSAPGFAPPLFPGACEAVTALAREPGTLLGVATGKGRQGLETVLAASGLRPCFCTMQTADDAPSKPHPAMIRQAMAEAGVQPRETVMVGDSIYDIEMARAAGVESVGVAWGFQPAAALAAAGAGLIAASFEDLLRILSPEAAL